MPAEVVSSARALFRSRLNLLMIEAENGHVERAFAVLGHLQEQFDLLAEDRDHLAEVCNRQTERIEELEDDAEKRALAAFRVAASEN